jgi:7,8-didemethyl-8-hydroxy-5-deazariboflavin synthase CofH subunit
MTSGDAFPQLAGIVERVLDGTTPAVARVLDGALSGREVTIDEGELLFGARGPDLFALLLTADELRRRAAGDVVTYVVNRNINFTNVCIKHCGFCAFSRTHTDREGYFLPTSEIVRRAREAWDLGATEICVQAGLPPKMDGDLYPSLIRAVKAELPELHIHGFSPEEVLYGSIRSSCSIEDYLQRLKDAGIGSLPGTSAEILDEEVRHQIAPGRISVKDWVRVITGAHRQGIPTTSTIMYGHVETPRHRAAHLALLRDIQKDTGGFTEFVPLSLIHEEAPMWHEHTVPGLRPGATGDEVVKMYAISRIMLYPHIRNIQVSWVKEGLKLAQWALSAGANDMGGTLINESISTAAGAHYGQLVPPAELRRWIRDAGRMPAERTTLYKIRRQYDMDPARDGEPSPLDRAAAGGPERFGSYFALIADDRFKFKVHYRPGARPVPVVQSSAE